METQQPSLTWKGCPGILMLSISRFHVPLGGAVIGRPHRWELKSRGGGGYKVDVATWFEKKRAEKAMVPWE